MTNCAIQIDLYMPTQGDIGSENIPSTDYHTFSYVNPL